MVTPTKTKTDELEDKLNRWIDERLCDLGLKPWINKEQIGAFQSFKANLKRLAQEVRK